MSPLKLKNINQDGSGLLQLMVSTAIGLIVVLGVAQTAHNIKRTAQNLLVSEEHQIMAWQIKQILSKNTNCNQSFPAGTKIAPHNLDPNDPNFNEYQMGHLSALNSNGETVQILKTNSKFFPSSRFQVAAIGLVENEKGWVDLKIITSSDENSGRSQLGANKKTVTIPMLNITARDGEVSKEVLTCQTLAAKVVDPESIARALCENMLRGTYVTSGGSGPGQCQNMSFIDDLSLCTSGDLTNCTLVRQEIENSISQFEQAMNILASSQVIQEETIEELESYTPSVVTVDAPASTGPEGNPAPATPTVRQGPVTLPLNNPTPPVSFGESTDLDLTLFRSGGAGGANFRNDNVEYIQQSFLAQSNQITGFQLLHGTQINGPLELQVQTWSQPWGFRGTPLASVPLESVVQVDKLWLHTYRFDSPQQVTQGETYIAAFKVNYSGDFVIWTYRDIYPAGRAGYLRNDGHTGTVGNGDFGIRVEF